MLRICIITLGRKWPTQSPIYLSRQSAASPLVINILKSSYSKKPAESNLRTYLDAVNNPDRIKDNDLADILVLLRDDQLAEVDAMEVLKCCSSKHVRHSQVLDDIWTELRSKPGRLDLHHYDALLRIFISKNKIFSPHAIFDEIIAQGLTPRISTCNLLILSCAQRGAVNDAFSLLEHMQRHDIAANEFTFNHLILAHANTGDAQGMEEIYKIMKTKRLSVKSGALNTLLKGYAKIGDCDKLNATLELFKTEKVDLLNNDIFNVISELIENGHTNAIDQYYNRLFNSLEYRYAAKGFITQMTQNRRFDVIEHLLSNNCDRCPVTYLAQNYLAEAVRTSCSQDEIERIWRYLDTIGVTIASNIGTYFPAALHSSSASLVKATLDGMKTHSLPMRDQHFIHWCHLEASKSPDAVLEVMRIMRFDFNVRPRFTMLRDTFLPLYDMVERPQLALAKLLTLDLSISVILTAVISRCMLNGRLHYAVEIANAFKNHYFIATQYRPYLIPAVHATGDLDNFVKFLRILRDDVERLLAAPESTTTELTKEQLLEQIYFGSIGDEVQVVGEMIHDVIVNPSTQRLIEPEMLLRKALHEGLQISKEIAVKIQQNLNRKPDSHLVSLLNQLSASDLKPRPMQQSPRFISPMKLLSSDELLTLIDLAESRGKSVAGSKRLLFQAYINENNLLAAEELIYDFDLSRSKKIYADVISLALNRRDVDKALDYFERAQTKCDKFHLSRAHALKIMAILLIRGHKFNEIQNMMVSRGLKYSFVLSSIPAAANYVLQEVGDSGDIDLTTALFDQLVENKHIKANVRTTAPLVKVHLKSGDVIDAFNVFEKIHSKYGCTPIKIRLCSKLIEKDDMHRLQKLFEMIADVHGEHMAMRALAYAFIEAKKIDQATIVLSNDILLSAPKFLKRDCNYFYQLGRMDILKGLLKATKNLDYDRSNIYRFMFLYYCKIKREEQANDKISDLIRQDDIWNEVKTMFKIESIVPKTKVEPLANGIADHESETTNKNAGADESQIPNEKLKRLLSEDSEHISKVTDIVLTCLKTNVWIDPVIMSQYLTRAAALGDTIVFDELWKHAAARNFPNFSQLYSRAYLNSTNPMWYIQKIEKIIESTSANSIDCPSRDDVNKLISVEDSLRFLQEHPHVINEYEAMAIKAASRNYFAPINVVWLYHFLCESPFIENLWLQHFAGQPEHFHTAAILRILDDEKCQLKLEKFSDFLITNNRSTDAASVQNARLRIYADGNCFTEAIKMLETSSIPIKLVDRKMLTDLRKRYEANGSTFPISFDQIGPNAILTN